MPVPEALAIASAVSALVSNAYKLCCNIYQTIDGIDNAPKHIRAISRDLKAFYSVLGTLKCYLDDEEISTGVLHPATSADLEAVLTNCVTIFKDFSVITNGYIRSSRTVDVTKWRSLQWTWKEKEVWSLREHLAAHKITLSVAIAAANLINTSTTSAATQRIEDDVRELKASLTMLLQRLERTEDRHQERSVILDNYTATIRRFARGADSIMTASTFPERPPSPSPQISFMAPSVGSRSTYVTAQSNNTELLSSVASQSTYETARSHLTNIELALTDNETSDTESIRTVQPSVEKGNLGPCRQLFVKGLEDRTIVLPSLETSFTSIIEIKERLQDITGIPSDRISLNYGGRLLSDGCILSDYNISHNSTLQASIGVWRPGSCRQLFVEGLGELAIDLPPVDSSFTVLDIKEMLQNRTGIPPHRIGLAYARVTLLNYRILSDYHIPHLATLHAIDTWHVQDWYDELEERARREYFSPSLSSSASTLDAATLGYYHRKETARQRLYAAYLRAKGALRSSTET